MADRLLSLIDVQVGMYRLSLQTKLTPPCFRFFWGLIMLGNTLTPRFKNPFDVTVEQAVGLGGGLSRQSINDKQRTLRKVRIDGEWLVKIKPGKRVNNTPALYEINYNLLVPQSLAVPTFEAQSSRKIDDTLDGCLDDPLPILRSDQRREEKIPPAPLNDVTTQVSSESENESGGEYLDVSSEEDLRKIQKATKIQDLIRRKWQGQISEGPDIGSCKAALREFDWDHKLLIQAVTDAPLTLNSPTPKSALNLISSIARRIRDEGNGGVSPELLKRREEEIEGIRADLKEARQKPEENERWISQHEDILQQKEVALERLRAE